MQYYKICTKWGAECLVDRGCPVSQVLIEFFLLSTLLSVVLRVESTA